MLRIVAWILILTLAPVILIAFFLTHFGALLWIALVVVIAGAIYGAVTSRRETVTKIGPPQ